MTYRLHCAECGEPFEAARPHAKTCGPACRSRRSRRLTAERRAAEVKRTARLLDALADVLDDTARVDLAGLAALIRPSAGEQHAKQRRSEAV
jgi:hypothetical protein